MMSFFINIKPAKAGGKEFSGDNLLELTHYLSEKGYTLESLKEDEILKLEATKIATDLVVKQGMTACLKQDMSCDSVLPVSDDVPLFVSIIQCHLAALKATDELLIIDSYFFPEKIEEEEYLIMLENMFKAVIPDIKYFKVIAKPRINTALKNQFFDRLKSINPSIQTEVIESNAFHDRFMLADGQRGAFIGTSLNGIGRKYALIDYMRDEDAQEIYAAYQAEV